MNKDKEPNAEDVASASAEGDALIADIVAAFDGISREDGTTLHEAEETDCHGTPEELLVARRRDTDTRWQEVRDEWIVEMPDACTFLDVQGLRYYLPAIMIWELKNGTSSKCAAGDNLWDLLIDPSRRQALLPLLTEFQARVTARWLGYIAKVRYINDVSSIQRLASSQWWALLPR